MSKSKHSQLVEKSLSAAIAAIEIYNKPNFQYREESFSILMLNAWELLLKARILLENKGDPKSIEIWEFYNLKSGARSRRRRPVKSRSDNIKTISIDRALGLVRSYAVKNVDDKCAENLGLLMEIRDTAIHFLHDDMGLSARVLDVGMASIQNYAHSISEWFDISLTDKNFYLMPLSFQTPGAVVESLTTGRRAAPVSRLLSYIANQEAHTNVESDDPYALTVRVMVKFARSVSGDAEHVRIVRGGEGVLAVTLTEEDIRDRYPWNYNELTKRLRNRYTDFKANTAYHAYRRPLEEDPKLCHLRQLNPDNPEGGQKRFYSPHILEHFDQGYERR